jgi:glycosyltransferase involved in cell wall biosynthesis
MSDLESGSKIELAKALRDSGNYEQALELLDENDLIRNGIRPAGLIARDCYMRMGEISMALGVVNHLLTRFGEDATLEQDARFLLGRLIETDPSWSPRLAPVDPKPSPVQDRVLHLLKESLPYSETGYTMRSAMTLEAQRRAGLDPVVVTSLGFPRRAGVTEFAPEETVGGIQHHRLDLGPEYPARLAYDLHLEDQLELTAKLAIQLSPSLVQAGSSYRGFDGILVGLPLARALDIPSVYEIRGFLEQTWTREVGRSESGEYYNRRRAQEYRCLSEATLVITIADAMRNEIIERGIESEKVHVVPNAVDVGRFTPRPKRGDLVDRYGLRERLVLGYISNLGWREGLEYLIAATKILVDKGRDLSCLIVGDGPERQKLSDMIVQLELENHVILAGHVPNAEIEEHYALIDIFVVPRVNDRASRLVTPLKPLEAMSMGLPVVASDLPALREQILDGERGLLFSPESTEDLAHTLDGLIVDDDLRKAMADAGSTWVRRERTLESNQLRYRAILDPLL